MANTTLIRARRLIAADGGEPIDDAALLIRDRQVVAVGPAASVRADDGEPVDERDYGDATILPGLIDVHTHPTFPKDGGGISAAEAARESDEMLVLQAAQNARIMLENGVTTAREMGAKNRVAMALRDGIQRGLVEGPRMVVAGQPVTMTGGHMWHYGGEADGVEAVRTAVRTRFKEGADYIKVAATGGGTKGTNRFRPSYTVTELAAAADEAHRFGKLVAAHASSSAGIENSLDAGIDLIAHCYFYDNDGSYRYREDLADRLAASAFVNPTLYLRRAEMFAAEAKRSRGTLTPGEEARLAYNARSAEQRIEGVARMARAGVRFVSGSDSPFGWYPAGEFVREVLTLAEAGIPNLRVIESATSAAAEAIGLGGVVGQLRPGLAADVLIVRGDPLRNLAALWSVLDVYRDGRRVQRAAGEAPDRAPADDRAPVAAAAPV